MNYYLILKSSTKFFFQLLIISIIFIPLILIYRSNKKKKKSILIIEKRYYDLKNKLLFHSELENSIKEYLKFSKQDLFVTTYYSDKQYNNFLKTNLHFLKFFYENYPEFLFFRTDWQDPKTLNISLHLCILLKLFEKNVVFYSHSGDPNWINNQVRSWVCRKVFDAHSFLPQVFIKKTNITEPMPEFGIPTSNLYEPSINREHEIFYIGRLPQDDERYDILNFLKKNKVDIKIFGETTNNFLSYRDYVEIYKNYKITINFPKQVNVRGITVSYAFRGRVLDALSNGVLLFDQKNPLMDLFFKEGVHYVNYNDKNDLLDKIRYYQKNYNTDGIKIANNGFNLVKTELNSSKVWRNIFKKI